jgi:hypothetical protein
VSSLTANMTGAPIRRLLSNFPAVATLLLVAIFSRITSRRRLREVTLSSHSTAVSSLSDVEDSTSWVIGGLWPVELSQVTAENVTTAELLKADLRRIVRSANAELTRIRKMNPPGPARRAQQIRAIESARNFAIQRVESTMRQLPRPADKFPAGKSQPATEDIETSTGRHRKRPRSHHHGAADDHAGPDSPDEAPNTQA